MFLEIKGLDKLTKHLSELPRTLKERGQNFVEELAGKVYEEVKPEIEKVQVKEVDSTGRIVDVKSVEVKTDLKVEHTDEGSQVSIVTDSPDSAKVLRASEIGTSGIQTPDYLSGIKKGDPGNELFIDPQDKLPKFKRRFVKGLGDKQI